MLYYDVIRIRKQFETGRYNVRTKLSKMFPRGLDKYELRCSDCSAKYRPDELAAADAHQNFRGHSIIVYYEGVGAIGPLYTFRRPRL